MRQQVSVWKHEAYGVRKMRREVGGHSIVGGRRPHWGGTHGRGSGRAGAWPLLQPLASTLGLNTKQAAVSTGSGRSRKGFVFYLHEILEGFKQNRNVI